MIRCMGGCQNFGAYLGTLNIRCHIKIEIQTGAIILTTTRIIFLGHTLFEEVPHLRMYNISRKAAPNLWKPGLAWGAGVGKKERAVAKVSGISALLKARLCG